MKALLLVLIKVYQKTLSFDHGPLKAFYPHGYCRFQPTCSDYTHQAVERFGAIKGGWLGMKRVSRCHPWNKGGQDPVPEK